MANQVVFYISAASDLEVEREILGRAVTEVPVDLGWRVVQSPAGNGPVDLEAITHAGVHVVLMGSDIRAPIGLEWQVARQAGRRPVAFLKQETLRTPAGQDFVRAIRHTQSWVPFADGAELRRKVLELLAEHLLNHAVHYVLKPEEMATLSSWRDGLAKESEAVDEETRGGAGESSVILSRERFMPSGGVIIGEATAEREPRS